MGNDRNHIESCMTAWLLNRDLWKVSLLFSHSKRHSRLHFFFCGGTKQQPFWSLHNDYELNLRPGYYDRCFYNGTVQSLIPEKFVHPLTSQNAVGYDNLMHTFYWWRNRPLTDLHFCSLRPESFPFWWPSTRFSNLLKIRIEKARLLNLWIQTESSDFG